MSLLVGHYNRCKHATNTWIILFISFTCRKNYLGKHHPVPLYAIVVWHINCVPRRWLNPQPSYHQRSSSLFICECSKLFISSHNNDKNFFRMRPMRLNRKICASYEKFCFTVFYNPVEKFFKIFYNVDSREICKTAPTYFRIIYLPFEFFEITRLYTNVYLNLWIKLNL